MFDLAGHLGQLNGRRWIFFVSGRMPSYAPVDALLHVQPVMAILMTE